jgi:predicted dehydrogenase
MLPTICLIGNGAWGKNYISVFRKLKIPFEVGDRRDWQQVIKKCDAVIVATSPSSHIDIAEYCLSNHLPTLIEKPISLSLQEINRIKSFEKHAPILVNYIHLFSPAYQKLKSLVDPINVKRIDSYGHNYGPYRNYSSLLDYAPHDLSMGIDLMGDVKNVLRGFTIDDYPGKQHCINIEYSNKVRHHMLIGNSGKKRRYFEVNDLDGKCFIYDDLVENKLTVNGEPIQISDKKPLNCVVEHFVNVIGGEKLLFDLSLSEKIMETIEKIG